MKQQQYHVVQMGLELVGLNLGLGRRASRAMHGIFGWVSWVRWCMVYGMLVMLDDVDGWNNYMCIRAISFDAVLKI